MPVCVCVCVWVIRKRPPEGTSAEVAGAFGARLRSSELQKSELGCRLLGPCSEVQGLLRVEREPVGLR